MDVYKEVKKDVLAGFHKVFGKGIVEKVYVITEQYDCIPVSQKDLKNDLKGKESELYLDKNKRIDNGCLSIVIKFKGGNEVLFTNSEWGSMSKANLESDEYQSI